MSELTLVILAAGMGQRFGDRIKQLEPLGPNGELLIDYSVHDALKNGFDRVVFIIRRDIEELFKSTIGARVEKLVKTEYVFQSVDQLPKRERDFPSRTKPWGTAQALYCCKDMLDNNFAVINADDFYGAEAFESLAGFLKAPDADACSVDFLLKNTLSEHGAVNRGICRSGADGLLTSVEETKQISRGADGVIRGKYDGYEKILDENATASMSMWGFKADFMPILAHQLRKFLNDLQPDELKAELTIADAVGREIKSRGYKVRDIPTDSKWFGITYESDVAAARETLEEHIRRG
ncbi:MAG: NTP transferase domain-containing protein, partial [Oscillospiraceae bacterium]|nr:NTP transferase domain-containing protein [Oscillospiraceae bacterium]